MKTLTATLLVCALSLSVSSQSLQWAFNIGSPLGGLLPGIDLLKPNIRSIATDSKGDILVTGVFWNNIDLDPGQDSAYYLASSHTGFVAKYSPQGNFLWGFALDTSLVYGNVVRCDANDNVFLGGSFRKADFDPSPDTFILGSLYSRSIYIAKFSPSGQFIHAIALEQGFGTYTDITNPVDFQIDSIGSIYCTGLLLNQPMDFDPSADSLFLQSQSGNEEIFIAKYTNNLSLVWAKRIGSNNTIGLQRVRGLALDESGSFYIGGYFAGDSVDFDPSPNTSYYLSAYGNPYKQTAFVAKYDTSGAFQWARKMEGNHDCMTYSLSICKNGDVLLSGLFKQWIELTPSAMVSNILISAGGSSDYNSFIARFTPLGDLMWGRAIASCEGVYVLASEDLSGNIIAVGDFSDTLFPFGINQPPVFIPEGTDMHIITYDYQGQLLSIETVGSIGAGFNIRVCLANQGSILVGGSFFGNMDFNPHASPHFLQSSNGQIFLAKYALNTGIETITLHNTTYRVFPNPATDYIIIQTHDNTLLSDGKVQIYNIQGALQLEMTIPGNQHQVQLKTGQLPAGLYLGRIVGRKKDGGGFRFVKE